MSDLSTFAAIGMAFFIVAVSPGPANLACASVAMAHGRAKGVRFAFGLALGLLFWGVVAALGLGVLLETSAHALFLLKLFGGLYLLYLALVSAKSAMATSPKLRNASGEGRWFLRGLVLNLANPKAVFAWMAALAVGLSPSEGGSMVLLATAMCGLIGLGNYLIWSMLFSTGGMMAIYARVRRWVDGVVAAIFGAAAIGLLRSAASR